eukprot:6466256-Amphidinium_carterae.1
MAEDADVEEGQVSRLDYDPRELLQEVQVAVCDGPLLDPLRGWRVGGCLVSWVNSLVNSLRLASALKIFEVRRLEDGSRVFVTQKSWLQVKRAVTDKLVPNMENFRHVIWNEVQKHLQHKTVPRVFRVTRGGSDAALVRRHGLSKVSHSPGRCCWCHDTHTGYPA